LWYGFAQFLGLRNDLPERRFVRLVIGCGIDAKHRAASIRQSIQFVWRQSLRDKGKCTLEKANCTLPILLPGSRADLRAQAWDKASHPTSANH
jgi:hypothetical protein